MRSVRITRALNRAVLASFAAPLVACGGITSGGASNARGHSGGATGSGMQGTGTSGLQAGGSAGGLYSGSWGSAGTGSNIGDVATSGSSTSGTGTSGAAPSGSSLSGTATSASSAGRGVDGGGDSSLSPGCALGPGSQQQSLYSGCGYEVDLNLVGPSSACPSVPDSSVTGGLKLPPAVCSQFCAADGGQTPTCTPFDDSSGGHVACLYPRPCVGRRPEGMSGENVNGSDSVGRFLAQTAYLESAAVHAFERLRRELEAHNAPKRLGTAARRAARDEMRHARVTKRLARRAGASVPEVQVERLPVRSLEEIAVENAIEGCVRETFGAAVAVIQGAQAGDEDVREAMKRIARDETRHAELSWAVAEWIGTQLNAAGRRRVHQARNRAVEALFREAAQEPDPKLRALVGVPKASQAHAVLVALQSSLWATEVGS